MRNGRKKLNHAGMTLVELIVVILILGILSVGGALGINYAGQMNSTSAAEKLVSLMERTRVYTISAEGTAAVADPADNKVTLVLTKEGNTYYGKLINGTTEVDRVALGNGSLSITATKEGSTGGDESTTIDNSTSFTISYNKANGAFADKYKTIVITGSKTKTIQMVHTTGRSYVK